MVGGLHLVGAGCSVKSAGLFLLAIIVVLYTKPLPGHTDKDTVEPWQWTPYYRMRISSLGSEPFPVDYCTLRPLYSRILPTLNYKSISEYQNQCRFPSKNGQSHARVTYWYKRVENLCLEDFRYFCPSRGSTALTHTHTLVYSCQSSVYTLPPLWMYRQLCMVIVACMLIMVM